LLISIGLGKRFDLLGDEPMRGISFGIYFFPKE